MCAFDILWQDGPKISVILEKEKHRQREKERAMEKKREREKSVFNEPAEFVCPATQGRAWD